MAHGSAFYGPGKGLIHMDDVLCNSTESRLIDCRHISRHDCGHSEDASVTCNMAGEHTIQTSTAVCLTIFYTLYIMSNQLLSVLFFYCCFFFPSSLQHVLMEQ